MNFFTGILLLFVPVCVVGNNRRIVGGHNITIDKAPYVVSLQLNDRHRCGGSIVARSYVVTAAHCVNYLAPQTLSIRAGTSTREAYGKVVQLKKVNIHPDYSRSRTIPDYDVAVLELDSSLRFGKKISAIKLPKKDGTWAPGTEAFIAGWGRLTEKRQALPYKLQGATVKLVDFKSCSKAYEHLIAEHMFCAGVRGGGVDACQYDSGGPLEIDGYLIGIIVYGEGCARPEYPGIYMNVFSMLDFIQKVIGKVGAGNLCQ